MRCSQQWFIQSSTPSTDDYKTKILIKELRIWFSDAESVSQSGRDGSVDNCYLILETWVWPLEPTGRYKKKTEPTKLSSGLHVCTIARAYPYTYIIYVQLLLLYNSYYTLSTVTTFFKLICLEGIRYWILSLASKQQQNLSSELILKPSCPR